MELKIIKNTKELETVRKHWENLQFHPNSDYSYYNQVLKARNEIKSPSITVVESEGIPKCIVVGRIEDVDFEPHFGYFKPIRIQAKFLSIIYQGVLGEINETIAIQVLQSLCSMLKRKEVDCIAFHNLSEDSALLTTLMTHGSIWWCEKNAIWSNHWEMNLWREKSFLENKVGSKQRWKIRKREKELQEAFKGKVYWRWISSFDNIPLLCKRIEEAARLTYHRGLNAGFKDDEEHRQRYKNLAENGHLRVQLLEIDDKVRAFWIGAVYKNIFHSFETGYDPAIRKFEPGTLVFMHMADELSKEGVDKIDFGLGDAIYKERYGDRKWREKTIRIYSPTLKGFYLKLLSLFTNYLDKLARYFLKKIGKFEKFKTSWRKGLLPRQ